MVLWYTQQLNVPWLKDPDLKDWFQQDSDNKDSSYCKCCEITLKNASKSTLIQQKDSDRHKKNYQSAKSATNISHYFAKKTSKG